VIYDYREIDADKKFEPIFLYDMEKEIFHIYYRNQLGALCKLNIPFGIESAEYMADSFHEKLRQFKQRKKNASESI